MRQLGMKSKAVHNLRADQIKVQDAFAKYNNIVVTIRDSEDVANSSSEISDLKKALKEIDLKTLKKVAGIDTKALKKALKKREISPKLREKILKDFENNLDNLQVFEAKSEDLLNVQSLSLLASDKSDRQSIEAEEKYNNYKRRTDNLMKRMEYLYDFIEKNSDVEKSKQVLQAFVEGDQQTLTLLDTGITFNKDNVAQLRSLGLKLVDLERLERIKDPKKLVAELQKIKDAWAKEVSKTQDKLQNKYEEKKTIAKEEKRKKEKPVKTKLKNKRNKFAKDLFRMNDVFEKISDNEVEQLKIYQDADQELRDQIAQINERYNNEEKASEQDDKEQE